MIAAITHLGLVDEEEIVLDVAALELAALDHPGVDLQPYAELLGTITERIAERGGEAETGIAQAAVLAEVIAGEYGFAGDRASYDDPANADLIRVIDRRRGLPVSLAILIVAAARRVSWSADALDTPGHVLVRVGPATMPVVIDPFAGGNVVAPAQIAALLAAAPDGGAPLDRLSPLSNRAVLVRLLLNQAVRAEQGDDLMRAVVLHERMTAVAPSNGPGWWGLARLRLIGGDVAAARGSLSAMLEVTRDPDQRLPIAAALEALAGREV